MECVLIIKKHKGKQTKKKAILSFADDTKLKLYYFHELKNWEFLGNHNILI